jgi:hypothetical protein
MEESTGATSAGRMRLPMILGAGVSVGAGLPTASDIDDVVRTGVLSCAGGGIQRLGHHLGTGGYQPVESVVPDRATERAVAFVQQVETVCAEYYSPKVVVGYEDVFYVVHQVYEGLNGNNDNPALVPLIRQCYWRLATHFLGLVEAASHELVQSENAWVLVADRDISESDYEAATRWSDHTLGIAVLFDFFHGVELMLKGFIALDGSSPRHHRLTGLLADFEASHPGTEVGVLVAAHTANLDPGSPLGVFLAANGLGIDSWNEALKYPESKKGESFDHVGLQYGGRATIDFWRTLGKAAREIRIASVRLARSLERT